MNVHCSTFSTPSPMVVVVVVVGRFTCSIFLLMCYHRSYGRLLRFVLRMIVFIFGFRVKVKGKKARPDEVTLMCVAPHSSFFDGMVYVIGGDDLPSMVSREENVTIPLLGRTYSVWCDVACRSTHI